VARLIAKARWVGKCRKRKEREREERRERVRRE
jgi:hypothetical protein